MGPLSAKLQAPQGRNREKPAGDKPADAAGTEPLNLDLWVTERYSYRPWEKVFPQLRIHPDLTESQLVFGQSLEWLSMRRMFAQYLDFCRDFYGVVLDKFGDKVGIGTEATTFRNVLDGIAAELTEDLMADPKKDAESERKAAKLILVNPATGLSFLQTLEKKLKTRLREQDFRLYESPWV